MRGHVDFDDAASDYDAQLQRGLSASGEDKNFFAKGRVSWLSQGLSERGFSPSSVLDYGCGTGSSVPFLLDDLAAPSVVGVDVSSRSIEIARRLQRSSRARFETLEDYVPNGTIDLAFCNGVFHHIPPSQRAGAVEWIYRALRPGGIWAFWENNPWNPGTQWVMYRIPFDRDAVKVTPSEARRLLIAGGFEILSVDHLFVFPRFMRWLRPLEPKIANLPLGAQYQILCRKPAPRD
ncbi:MAG: class I SAM-dependent methyltransferase [Polyangiaceae bacterium]|nr:class I SAM-dependent methyltransferase [Polyangiaceae bacterium]